MNLRLPPGFRFHPTDEELVVQYLKRKLQSCPLPASIIPEANVCRSDPWDLPVLPGQYSQHQQQQQQQERFFFSTREIKYSNGKRSNRATQSGYWKATGLDKQIVASGTRQAVGMKKTLVFYKGKAPAGSRTDWIMHEYRVVTPTQAPEKWVLCRIFLKNRGKGNGNKEEEEETKFKPIFYEFLATASPKGESSSCSSGITITVTEADAYEDNCLVSAPKFN